jgi:hypothetical protein
MTREEILAEIQRTAEENGGVPLGRDRFEVATGIKQHELYRYWPRFGDAVREAGFEPNFFNAAYSEEYLIDQVIALIRELGKFPTRPEMAVKRHSDLQFPNESVFRRFGTKAGLAAKVLQHCEGKPELTDIAEICRPFAESQIPRSAREDSERRDSPYGFVYLIKGHPGEFKIGHTNLVDRRVSELGATFPIEQELVHTIKTDDPAGVEAYWHKRFESKRMKGEWFRLKPDDVRAFKRWRRIL